MTFKKILLAVNDSPYAKKGLDLVNKITICEKTPVLLVHVIDPIPNIIGGSKRKKLRCDLEEMCESTICGFRDILEKNDVPVSGIIAEGDTADEILAISKSEGCDLIVIGAKGAGRLESFILGNVAQQVLHHAEIPVLIAR